LLSVLAVYLTGYFSSYKGGVSEFFLWILGQISFVQFYNPDFMREFGTGVLNGSLWTISVELQLYFIIPLLYFFINKIRASTNTILVLLIILFAGINQLYVILGNSYSGYIFYKLFHVSFAPWLYMFLVGVFFQHNFAKIYSLTKKFRVIIGVLSILYITIIAIFDISMGNSINPVAFSILAILLFFIAYSSPKISDYVLRRNDISYGVYIYHIPIINIFIYYGYVGSTGNLISMIILTIMMATFSWVIVERPSLLLKKKTIHSLFKN
jgi:peptidoglycan/LPS O-acetylase OafA/YrhL